MPGDHRALPVAATVIIVPRPVIAAAIVIAWSVIIPAAAAPIAPAPAPPTAIIILGVVGVGLVQRFRIDLWCRFRKRRLYGWLRLRRRERCSAETAGSGQATDQAREERTSVHDAILPSVEG
jgi:hypothetical protein